MAKSSPIVRSLNAGEFSALMEGRTDLDFYPASMRRSHNCIITPQGPVICRSGTKFAATACSDDETSTLFPFVYNTEQTKALEFGLDRIRFHDENGIQVYSTQAATVSGTTPFKLQIPTLAAVVGNELALSGFPASYNLNGEIVKIVAAVGTEYTLDRNVPASVVGAALAALVYSVAIDYTETQRQQLAVIQDVDLMYLLCGSKRTKKLQRYGDYDWRLSDVEFIDGPYLPENDTTTTMTIGSTGNAVAVMTTNSAPAGNVAAGSGERGATAANGSFLGRTIGANGLAATSYFHAFDSSDDTYWASTTAQTGTLEYTPAVPFALDGYAFYAPLQNDDPTYLNTDFCPRTFYVEGYTGSVWVVLDYQEDYKVYDGDRSVFFEVANTTIYQKYRTRVIKVQQNGGLEPRIRRWTMRDKNAAPIAITVSGVAGVNKDQGFVATDAGRLIRIKGADNFWRVLRIANVASQTSITANLLAAPFLETVSAKYWRIGIWSDTTGWPAVGDIFGERLFLGPSDQNPNVICGSVVGLYENFTHVEEDGTVLDDGAIVHYLKSRQSSRLKWIVSNEKGMLAGTGSQEFVIEKSVSGDRNFTPGNISSKISTRRGSTDADPVSVDNRILHVPRNGRNLREMTYSFDADSYVSNNLSRFSSHLGVPGFEQQAYSIEPHNIDWIRRGDGSMVTLTYNRDEGVVGWGQQDFSSAIVESIVVIPSPDQQQDTLWMQTRRLVNGVQKRYIEFLTQSWDFGMDLDDAWFVDCGLRYEGAATNMLYGLQYLEGEEVYGLGRKGDGTEEEPYEYLPFGPVVVVDGAVSLDFEINAAVVGLGFESVGETSRLENGATNGTAQGKIKRINEGSMMVWATATGDIGVWDENEKDWRYDKLEFDDDNATSETLSLHTAVIKPTALANAYSERGSVSFRRRKEQPLPFNIVAIMPQMETYE